MFPSSSLRRRTPWGEGCFGLCIYYTVVCAQKQRTTSHIGTQISSCRRKSGCRQKTRTNSPCFPPFYGKYLLSILFSRWKYTFLHFFPLLLLIPFPRAFQPFSPTVSAIAHFEEIWYNKSISKGGLIPARFTRRQAVPLVGIPLSSVLHSRVVSHTSTLRTLQSMQSSAHVRRLHEWKVVRFRLLTVERYNKDKH